jgi:hypothetical protein
MPYTYEDFHCDYTMPFIESLSTELRLKGIPPEERLKGLPPSEIEAYLLKLKKESQSE